MNKKQFIQGVVMRSLPQNGKLSDAVRYAENLWEGLTAFGYGDEPAAKPRESKSWLNDMSAKQKSQFFAFWDAFGYKKDQNGAAMRWLQMGELSDEDAKVIIDAARKEAAVSLPQGQARKMAQGWLFDKRWLDHKPTVNAQKSSNDLGVRMLISELNSVKMLYEKTGDEALLSGISKIEQKLHQARTLQHSSAT